MGLSLDIVPGPLTICRLPETARLPDWLPDDGFLSVTRTEDELSIVCRQHPGIPETITRSTDWSALRVAGPLDLGLTGIMADLSGALARATVPIFAISTHDTDYLLVKLADLERAVAALERAGHTVSRRDDPTSS